MCKCFLALLDFYLRNTSTTHDPASHKVGSRFQSIHNHGYSNLAGSPLLLRPILQAVLFLRGQLLNSFWFVCGNAYILKNNVPLIAVLFSVRV